MNKAEGTRLSARLWVCVAYLPGLLPYWLLHLLADLLALVVYYLVRYRRRVVRTNLSNSFPEKTAAEIRRLEKVFYRHFARQNLDLFKLMTFSPKQAARHIGIENLEVLDELRAGGAPAVCLLTGHFGYWEYFTAAPLFIGPRGYDLYQIYRPLKSKSADFLMRKIRGRFGAYGIAKEDTGRALLRLIRTPESKQTPLVVFIGDQTPSRRNIHLWCPFLNQESAFFTGAERLAAKFDLPVLYLDVYRKSSTRYVGRLELLCRRPGDAPLHALTVEYARRLEETIRRNPPYWLWSHRRWKHRRADFDAPPGEPAARG